MPGFTMVGIPALNEVSTVSSVVRAADAGLAEICSPEQALIVLADNGSTDGTPGRFADTATAVKKSVLRSDGLNTGKGTNVFALVAQAWERGADRLVLMDADVRSAKPWWVTRLASAVDVGQPTLATPTYQRSRYEANITNHLAGPLVAALFGAHIQQPIGGEFAMNRELLRRVSSWPRAGSTSLYGIDIWLTANSLLDDCDVVEVSLGRKLHDPMFKNILHMPLQVLDSLLRVSQRIDRPRLGGPKCPGNWQAVDPALGGQQDVVAVAEVTSIVAKYLAECEGEVRGLFPNTQALREAPWGFRIHADDWPALLADAVQALALGHFQATRDHLAALYMNRVLSYQDEIADLSTVEVDKLLTTQIDRTVEEIGCRAIQFNSSATLPTEFHRGNWARFPPY